MTPCKDICKLDDNNWYCIGCFRTVNEIANWMFYEDAQKYDIMQELDLRKADYESDKRIGS